MKNTQQLLFTVRFPAWSIGETMYPAFGARYLVEVPIEVKDEEQFFKDKFKEIIGRGKTDFVGEILFVEETEISLLLK